MTYDEFKQNFLPEFLKITSFAGRMKYANQNLQRIGSGTGRVVYDIDGQKVLKLAKNQKGIAQNEAEAGAGYYRDTQNIITEVFDNADDDSWLISEKAKKVNEKRIKELTGIPSLNDLYYFLRNYADQSKGKREVFHQEPEISEFFWENEFSQDLANFISNYNQSAGDMGRPSTYGEVLRDGQPTIVLTDYGLNDEVYNTHYSPNRKKSRYQMYELYNYADGNDDILSDAGGEAGGNEIRTGMWAQMPYSVSDGGDNSNAVINEEFINFISNRETYPNKPISGLPVLADNFHECVNNICEILKRVDNKKQFYHNLLELQTYLTEQGYYDRDPLMSEEYQINEETPKVEKFSLEDRNYANLLAKEVASKLGLTTPKYLGGGANGFAYEINNDLIMKLTADISEADAASKLLRGRPKYIATIFKLYKIIDTEKNQAYYAILQENINNKPINIISKAQKDVAIIKPAGLSYVDILMKMKIPARFNYDELMEIAKHILNDNPEAGVSQVDRQTAYNFIVGLLNIRKELIEFGIKSTDYVESQNLGYKDNLLKFFDVGGYSVVSEPDLDNNNIISLPENKEVVKESYDRNTADIIANKVAEKMGLPEPKYIGGGCFGIAYDIDNNKVLKITKDKTEASENSMLIGRKLKYIAEPYNVFQIDSKSVPNAPQTFGIILEKLQTDPEIQRMHARLEFAFEKIMKVQISDVIKYYLGEWDNGRVSKQKIDSYLKKNPKDAEFFGGMVRIAEEVKDLGIESMDYLNPYNLGYKKNGALGFFDLGWGNFLIEPQNVQKIEVEEDGSAKFSSNNAINQDEFPVYNTNDTSPSINNDLDANIAMYEDLEYNHVVGDATQDKFELTEEDKPHFKYEKENNEIKRKQEETLKKIDGLGNDVKKKYFQNYTTPEDLEAILNQVNNWYPKQLEVFKKMSDIDKKNYGEEVNKIQNFLKKTQKYFLQQSVNIDKRYRGENQYGLKGDINSMYLYHFTTVNNAISIINDGYFMGGGESLGISTTTNKDLINQLQPIFYHSSEYSEGKTFRNLSTCFVLDFNKIKADNIKYRVGSDNDLIGTHFGEEEIKLYPTNDELDVFKYLMKVIIDPSKESNKKSQIELINLLKEKNIQFFMKDSINERDKSFGSGSKTVEVKKKCRLGGNGDGTSTACNQGDDNNLIFGKVNENIENEKYYRVVEKNMGKTIEFEPEGFYEAIDDNGNPIYHYDTFWQSEIPEVAASKTIGGAVMGLYSMFMSNGKNPSIFYIYEINEKPDVDISHWDMGDFYHLKEVRYRRPVRGTYKGKVTITDDMKKRLNAFYEMNNLEAYDEPDEETREVFDDTDYEQYLADVNNMVNEKVSIRLPAGDIKGGFASYNIVNDGQIVGEMELMTRNKYLVLDKIFIEKEFRGAGYANDAIRLLFDYADKQNKIITLTPDSIWGANKNKLQKWYQSLGFVMNKGKNKDFETMQLMYRLPKGLEINEYFSSLVPDMNEEITSLQDLPFNKEVEQLGGKIFSVGGAVRDEFLGKESKDLDVLVTGIPMDKLEQVLSKYGGVNAVGKSFGVLKFVPKGSKEEIDIAIPRTEVATGAGGHQGFDVKSDHALPIEKDLERRDFTINAIAKDINGKIIDPYGGQEDLKNKIIRIVNPVAFSDDPLRMLRAVQFASRFGFVIEPTTMKMIEQNAPKIKEIAPERILIELEKIVTKGNALIGVQLLANTGLFKQIFGNEIKPSQIERRDFNNVKTMAELLFLMMNGVVQNPAEFYLNRFATEDAKRDKIYKELQALDLAFNSDLLDQQMSPVKARSIAHNMFTTAPQTLESQILPEQIKRAAQELLQGKYPKTVNELQVNGNDLIQVGLQGKAVGDMQKSILIQIYADKVRNNKEELLSLVKNKKTQLQERYYQTEVSTWNINGEQVDVNFFVEKYDEWNYKYDRFIDHSRESVARFIEDEFPEFVNDEKLKKELYWALTDREVLNEDVKKTEKVEFGALMLFLDVPVWKKITSVIKKDDIYEIDDEFGIETEPHVTILYGFHSNVDAKQVFDLYKKNFDLKPIEIGVEGISIFENKEFDVVKMDVDSKILTEMNSVMRELPNTNTYPEYHAHITLAYVKKGTGEKYVKKFEKNRILVGNELVFSTKKEKKSKLKLDEKGVLKEEVKGFVLNEIKYFINERKSEYTETKESLMKSKSIGKEMKEEILKYLTSGSKYHEGGRVTSLKKPKELIEKSSKSNGVSMGADKDGFFVYTHRARSKSHLTPDKITVKEISFIDSTG